MWKKYGKSCISCFIGMMIMITSLMTPVEGLTTDEVDLSMEDFREIADSYTDVISYETYLEGYSKEEVTDQEYVIEANAYTQLQDMEVSVFDNYEGMEGQSILTDEKGLISYEVKIEKSGFYNMSMLYYPIEGKSSAIQRSIFIDGQLPFAELQNVEFDRIWGDREAVIIKDNQGNELKPNQVEKPEWIEEVITDYQGYYTTPYQIYLEKGSHVISLLSRREPMLLRSIRLFQSNAIPTYEELKIEYEQLGYVKAQEVIRVIEAEQSSKKSSQMLYPIVNHSSPAVTPYSPKENRMNTIGGNNWRSAGQWIEWEFEVPSSGLYEIGMNVLQNFVRGIYTSRAIYLDGEIPFQEMNQVPFTYSKDWQVKMLGNGEENFLFYLEEGKHTLRMEVVLGDLSEVIRQMEESVRSLNEIYRRVLSITGTSPDKYRDYQIERTIPGLGEELYAEYENMVWVLDQLESMAGKISDREAGLITMKDQLLELYKDVEKTPRRLSQFKQNIGSLGTWITQAIEQPLQLDKLYVQSSDQGKPKLKDSWWDKLVHEVLTLFYSFIIDYNAIGNVADAGSEEVVTVWVGTGRDQANVMKSMIDEEFTKETGININLMLVDMSTLLPATLSGQGPDVAMQVGNDLPMNYGMRNAVTDLSGFEGFDEVSTWFYDSALLPYRFEEKCFALPEQQTFNMLFYRKDILKDLELEVPKTWEDVKVALSVLSKNQMGFGMLPSGYSAGLAGMPPVSEVMFGMFLYQNGGTFYEDDAKRSGLDTETAINAFKEFTEYYTDYGLEREFDIVNRFRTGEMPLIVADYTTYNSLQVSAPEIKGLWGFAEVPGTVQDDGSINSDVASSGMACIMMEQSKNKEAAWEFMKWWVSEETQTRYGREMEGLMGSAARYPTANIEAFANLPWPIEDYLVLSEQFAKVKGIPQVPGGYFTSRHINNAFYKVVVEKEIGPREAMTDYVRYINDEIRYKRAEFNLEIN